MADPIGGLAMLPSASNATLPTARVNLLGTPTLNYILIGNGIDWVRSPFTNGIAKNAGIWSSLAQYPDVGTVVQYGTAHFANIEPILGAPAAPVPAIEGAVTQSISGSEGTIILTTTSPDFIVVAAATYGKPGPSINSVSSPNLSFSLRTAHSIGGGGGIPGSHLEIWVAKSDDALTEEVITVAAAGTPDAFRVLAFGVSGIDLSGTGFDSNASLPAFDGGNGTPTVTGLSTTAANTVLLFFNAQNNNLFGTYSATPPTGFTLIDEAHDGNTGLEAFYQTVSLAQSSISIALSGSTSSQNWLAIGDALLTLAAANVTPDNDPRWVKIGDFTDAVLTAKFGSAVGSLIVLDTDLTWKALPPGPANEFLQSAGSGAALRYAAPAGSGVGLYSPLIGAVPTQASTGLGTWLNQGSATAVDGVNGVSIRAPAEGTYKGAFTFRGLYKAVPATPYSFKALIGLSTGGLSWAKAGLGWFNPGTGKAQAIYLGSVAAADSGGAGSVYEVADFTLPTTFNGVVTLNNGKSGANVPFNGNPAWFKIRDDGTNIYVYLSASGGDDDFAEVYTVAKASGFLGSTGYSDVMFFVTTQNNLDVVGTLFALVQGT